MLQFKKLFMKTSTSVSTTRLMGGNTIWIMPEQFDIIWTCSRLVQKFVCLLTGEIRLYHISVCHDQQAELCKFHSSFWSIHHMRYDRSEIDAGRSGVLDVISRSRSICRLHLQSSKHRTCAYALNNSRSPDFMHHVSRMLLWRHQLEAGDKLSCHNKK